MAEDDVSCADIDECKELEEFPNGGCDHTCHNEIGTYHCTCPKGYALVNGTKCVDIDECKTENGGCQQVCVNTKGSHLCDCFDGYQSSTNTTCEDIDECLVENGGCTDTCTNLVGSFECSCNPGFEFDPTDTKKLKCRDINECNAANTSAHFHGCSQLCHNQPGEFECGCEKGYTLLDDKKTCEDIDECLGNHGCHSTAYGPLANGAKCKNTPGSYICLCTPPLVHVDNVTCDIDECHPHVGQLPPISAPAAAPAAAGGANYTTKVLKEGPHEGFSAGVSAFLAIRTTLLNFGAKGHSHQNHTLRSRQEPGPDNGGCSHGCQNLPGGYVCTCPVGFVLDENPELEDPGKNCKDIDECTDRPDLVNCHGEGSMCQNTPGSFTCACTEGYKLNADGLTCKFVANQEIAEAGAVVIPEPPVAVAVGAPFAAPGLAAPAPAPAPNVTLTSAQMAGF